MADEVSVLVVDDSALMRNIVGRMVEETPGLVVADKAMNGKFALQKIPVCNPDIIVLDLEMPEMNGIEFLKERRKQGIKIPVVVLSSLAARGAEITMEALSLGASDFIQKPSGSVSHDINAVKDTLSGMLLSYGNKYRRMLGKKVVAAPEPKAVSAAAPPRKPVVPGSVQQLRKPKRTEIIAIGISTGGPDALRQMFAKLDPDLKVPILVVQHMPAGFTKEFANSLSRVCPLEVKEAEDGDAIQSGRILIAKGNLHMEVEKKSFNASVRLSETPQVSGHRPSADVLFASVALAYTSGVLGVIMTGMGRDGAQQLGTIYKEGGITLGQDERSSVVYGMPRIAYEMGHVMEQVSLDNMAKRICELAKEPR